jgi:hypothetical protein
MAENIMDYQTLLADMEAKKAVLEQAISALRAAIAAGALGQPGEIPLGSFSTGPMGGSVDLPVGAFLGKSLPAAVRLYLLTIRKKQTTSQIATALKEGGVETTADNFEQVVAGALFRLKHAGEVLRFPDGWGFAEHYPERIRKAVTQEPKKLMRKRLTKKGKATMAKIKKEQPAKVSSTVVIPINNGLEKRIEAVLKSDSSKSFNAGEIATTLDVGTKGVILALGRMAAKNTAEKCGDGKYRAATKQIKDNQKVG